jgi:hypothetical protein
MTLAGEIPAEIADCKREFDGVVSVVEILRQLTNVAWAASHVEWPTCRR